MRLSFESLEDRRTLSAWTVNVWDSQNLVSAAVENQMKAAGNFVMWDLDQRLSWRGTLDMVIDVRPNDPNYDGFTPSITQVMPGGRNATIYEMQTGIDPMPNSPDLGMTCFLGRDGTVKLYGMKAYFDPDPGSYTPANVPSGYFDFIGVLTHESAHSLAFQAGTTDFSRYMTTDAGGNRFFNGPETMRLLGRSLPLTTMAGTHYGNGKLLNNPIRSGLMYEWGNYSGNRLNWGKLDFAVLKDVGINVKNTEGLPFLDTMDWDRPRFVLSGSVVSENMAPGTFVATIGTTKGSNYTFQLLPVFDGDKFRLNGTTLVTAATFDYETQSTFTIYVRSIDRDGVWNQSKLTIRVLDVFENPSLQLPSVLYTNSGVSLMQVQVGGNNETKVTFMVSCSSAGNLYYNGSDPEVQVLSVKNFQGGMTLSMTGTRVALNRNFARVVYIGAEDLLSAQITANGRNWGMGTITLLRSS